MKIDRQRNKAMKNTQYEGRLKPFAIILRVCRNFEESMTLSSIKKNNDKPVGLGNPSLYCVVRGYGNVFLEGKSRQ